MKFSPLFWPIQLKGNIIYILDETRLPQRMVYIQARNYQEACKAIKEMKTRAVGQVLLVMYAFILSKRQKVNLTKVAKAINATRPTLAFRFLTDMVLNWDKNNVPLDRGILGFLDKLKAAVPEGWRLEVAKSRLFEKIEPVTNGVVPAATTA